MLKSWISRTQKLCATSDRRGCFACCFGFIASQLLFKPIENVCGSLMEVSRMNSKQHYWSNRYTLINCELWLIHNHVYLNVLASNPDFMLKTIFALFYKDQYPLWTSSSQKLETVCLQYVAGLSTAKKDNSNANMDIVQIEKCEIQCGKFFYFTGHAHLFNSFSTNFLVYFWIIA